MQTLETIKYYFESEHYIADPHTAVGLCAARTVASQKWVSSRHHPFPMC